MLVKEIKWTDFNGEERQEKFYFNLSRTQLLRLELSRDGGITNYINRLIDAKKQAEIMEVFDEIMEKSYGIKSDDGRQFIQGPDVYKEFTQTGAYDTLFMELISDDKAANAFIEGLLPPEVMEQVRKEAAESGEIPKVEGEVVQMPTTK